MSIIELLRTKREQIDLDKTKGHQDSIFEWNTRASSAKENALLLHQQALQHLLPIKSAVDESGILDILKELVDSENLMTKRDGKEKVEIYSWISHDNEYKNIHYSSQDFSGGFLQIQQNLKNNPKKTDDLEKTVRLVENYTSDDIKELYFNIGINWDEGSWRVRDGEGGHYFEHSIKFINVTFRKNEKDKIDLKIQYPEKTIEIDSWSESKRDILEEQIANAYLSNLQKPGK